MPNSSCSNNITSRSKNGTLKLAVPQWYLKCEQSPSSDLCTPLLCQGVSRQPDAEPEQGQVAGSRCPMTRYWSQSMVSFTILARLIYALLKLIYLDAIEVRDFLLSAQSLHSTKSHIYNDSEAGP